MAVPTIWVISSDPEIRRLIALNLSKRGFRILEFALPISSPPSGEPPRLIILDLDAESSDGFDWEAVETLRQHPVTQAVPVLLLLSAPPRAEQLSAFQPARWVEKPLAMDVLLRAVRESLNHL